MKYSTLCLMAIALMFAGCKKKDSTTPATTTTTTTTPTTPTTPANGTLWALKSGNSWTVRVIEYYGGTALDTTQELITESNDSVIGSDTWHKMQANLPGGGTSNTLITNKSNGVYIYEIIESDMMYKYPASVNDKFVDFQSDSVTVVSINASVTVPAGTFTCYQYKVGTNSNYYYYDWEAPGVGIVKQEFYDSGDLVTRNELMSKTLH